VPLPTQVTDAPACLLERFSSRADVKGPLRKCPEVMIVDTSSRMWSLTIDGTLERSFRGTRYTKKKPMSGWGWIRGHNEIDEFVFQRVG